MDAAPPSSPGRGGRLLERERELAVLDALVAEAAGGAARLALVEGPAGIGKSRLVGEVKRRAGEGELRVLAARGGELEREFPFGVVRQLFEPALVHPEERERLLAGAAAAALPVFDAPGESPREGGDASFAILHGLYWLAVNLSAERPLVLAVDDLHWCDHPSLRFLAYLVRRLEGLPVLAVCSLRPSEPGVDTALLAEIAADPLTVSVVPGPLTEPAVAELVRERLGEDAEDPFAAACHSATGGNPLLLNELLKALDAEGVRPDAEHVGMVADLGPRAASRAVLLRLSRLSPDAIEVARSIAVLGDGADPSAAAALAGVDLSRAAAAIGELARAEILRPEPPLGFVHPLVGAAVYRDVPPGERELRHERAAEHLAGSGASVEQVAAHLILIPPGRREWVAETLVRAADAALRKGAAESAVTYLSRALAEPPPAAARTQVLLDLGLAEALTDGPAATAHLGEAFADLADPRARGEVAQVYGRALLQTGSGEEAAEVARRTAAELPPELAEQRLALEAFEHTCVLFGVGDPASFAALDPYRDPRLEGGVGTRMMQAIAAIVWCYEGESAAACAELARAALADGALTAADNGFLAIAPRTVLDAADRDEEVVKAWDDALADAHRLGSLYSVSSIHLWHGFALYRRGELAEAQEELEAAVSEFGLWGFGQLAQTYVSGFLTSVCVARGDLEAARRACAGGEDSGLTADGIRYWLQGRMELELAEGRAEDALATAAELRRRFTYFSNPALGPWRSLEAQALDALGRREEALAAAAEEFELARRWGAPGPVGRALRVLGELERDEGVERLAEAVELLDRSPARFEHARALASYGAALRRLRRPTEAREPLRRALELANVCGAEGLAEQVRAELNAAGVRPRTTALSGVGALTASERRVAALAASGQMNREIAQALFVTPKTIEVHLSSAYRKLGIRSRRELAAALGAS